MEMLRTFNMGQGFLVVVRPDEVQKLREEIPDRTGRVGEQQGPDLWDGFSEVQIGQRVICT